MHFLGSEVRDNGLLLLAGKVSVLLPIPLVIAAVLSQFSAAVADIVAGGGNVAESTEGRVDERRAYVLICGIAVVRGSIRLESHRQQRILYLSESQTQLPVFADLLALDRQSAQLFFLINSTFCLSCSQLLVFGQAKHYRNR